jgi:branched-chain amino acid transport system substrate-binding protein
MSFTRKDGKLAKRALLALCGLIALAEVAHAQAKYDDGASDKEITIGQTAPYSGPLSILGALGKVQVAYFKMVNERGGINGRKINFISLDDAYQPPRTVEQTRKLVEEHKVLAVTGVGVPTSAAVQRYLNTRKVPQIFLATGASRFADPKNFPWTMGWMPINVTEGSIYAKHILDNVKDAKIGVLYQNDDFGKDFITGFKSGLGDQATRLIVKETTYEVTDPTLDSQIISLQSSGANVLFTGAAAKFGALALRKVYDIGWKPTHYLANTSTSIAANLTPIGLEKAIGVLSTRYLKDPSDPAWANDKAVQDYLAFLKKYAPDLDPNDTIGVIGYSIAQTIQHVLQKSGDDLTRQNLMRQAASLTDVELPMLIPGIRLKTTVQDYTPIEQLQLIRFDGKIWQGLGDVMSGGGR